MDVSRDPNNQEREKRSGRRAGREAAGQAERTPGARGQKDAALDALAAALTLDFV